MTGSVDDALRLGCAGIGFTIYPGSLDKNEMFGQLRAITAEAKAKGLAVVTWSYPRGAGMSKAGETGIDVVAYAAHLAAQLGAHIIKVKPPSSHIEQDAAREVYASEGIPVGTLTERIAHVVQACFAGRRIVIFSGGAAKGREAVLEEVAEIAAGGGFGAIVGRNAFQRPRDEALALLGDIMSIYETAA